MASPTPPLGSPAQYSIQQMPGSVYQNLTQEIIYITADKAYRYLNDWRQKLEAQDSWIAPLSLSVTLLLALLTADFKDKFSVSKEHWASLFIVGFVVALVWLLFTLKRRLWNSAESTDDIIEKFKNLPSPPPKLGFLKRLNAYYTRGWGKPTGA